MADEKDEVAGELAADEKAYHESRGEKVPAEKPDADAEAEADIGLSDDEAPAKKELVPLKTLLSEREEGKRARAALQEAEKRAAILEDRWNTILALNEQQQQPEQPKKLTLADLGPPPDKNVDIFKWAEWTAKRQAIQDETIEALQKNFTEKEQTEKQAVEENQREKAVWAYWHQDRAAFQTQHPDFEDAATWMASERTKQLSALKGLHPHFQSQAGINQQINAELKQIVIASAQSGVSPAEYVYNMAREWGYNGPAPKPDTAGLEKLTKDMDAEISLSGAGGSRPGGALDAKAIADMSPSDFEAWYAKNGSAAFKRIQTRGNA